MAEGSRGQAVGPAGASAGRAQRESGGQPVPWGAEGRRSLQQSLEQLYFSPYSHPGSERLQAPGGEGKQPWRRGTDPGTAQTHSARVRTTVTVPPGDSPGWLPATRQAASA